MLQAENANQGGASISIGVLEREFHENKAKVVDMLIENCMQVDVSIPRVVRGNFEEEE